MQASEAPRKSVKGKGIDPEAARRNREGRAVQLRKEKRFDRANIERRKFKTDDSPDPAVQSSTSSSHSYAVLPQKCSLLNSNILQEQLDGAMFFRRILAADKNPPLDVVIESGVVVPALVRFLSRADSVALQSEAAWCLTNIACGEPRHIHNLLDCGAMAQLMEMVVTSKSIALKDQALWAVCNMTSTLQACEYALSMPNFMVVVLNEIGLQCEIATPEGHHSNTYTSPNSTLQRIVQTAVKEFPTLSTMRHVAFICGNIARMKKTLPMDWYRMMLYALSELLYSPDDEIVLDICACLITLLQDHAELAHLILELGFVGKLRENLEASHVTPAVYELSLLVLCAILRGNSILHRTVVLRVNSSSGGISSGGVCAHGHAHSANLSPLTSSNTMDTSFATAFSASEAPMSVFSFDSTATQGEGDDSALTMPTTFQPGNVLTHIVLHLSRTTNALTKSDLCRALVCTMDFGGSCANDCFGYGLLGALSTVLLVGSHDLTVDAGEVLCAALLSDGVQLTELLSNQCLKLLLELIETPDLNLLVNLISSIKVVFTQAMMNHHHLHQAHVVTDTVDELLVHPNPQIADLALSLEDMVSCYGGEEVDENWTDDDEY